MVIGDSFTTDLFTTMLVQHVGRVDLDRSSAVRLRLEVDRRLHPDEVWWMPNERFLTCKPGSWPVGLDR